MHNWQHPEWPSFIFAEEQVTPLLDNYQEDLATHLDLLKQLPDAEREGLHLATSVEEGVRSSFIEGEEISREAVRSSLLNNLRFGPGAKPVLDLRARGVAAMMQEALRDPGAPITETMLRYWHELLFRGQHYPGLTGHYRTSDEPMQIISGPEYRRTVYYTAPPSEQVPTLMEVFVSGLDRPLPLALRAGLAHLHFESIHPFSDGNGRIGRALLERMLLEPFGGLPVLSISHAIHLTREAYYQALQSGQSSLDATQWLCYLLRTARQAIYLNQELAKFTLRKVQFFASFNSQLNEAQAKALRKMWEAGLEGFQGGMNSTKYRRINRVSSATATRDLRRLGEIGALRRQGAGRGTHYLLPT